MPAPRSSDRPPTPVARSSAAVPIVLGLGSMGIGGLVAAAALNSQYHRADPGGVALVALIWILIAVINVAYARRH
jgi:hypothetical protein